MSLTVEIVTGDICDQPDIEVIVNAANAHLQPGAGVCGAIFKAAGPHLFKHIRQCTKEIEAYPLEAGEVYMTPAFGTLQNKRICHAVGPIYDPEESPSIQDEEIFSAYFNSVLETLKEGYTSIAFPAISCGIYGYPVDRASKAAMEAIKTLSNLTSDHCGNDPLKDMISKDITVRFVFIPFADGPYLQSEFQKAYDVVFATPSTLRE